MIKSCPLIPIQKALYEKLRESVGVDVYDIAPDSAAYPYITIGDDSASDAGSKLDHGDDISSTIHVWSRSFGLMEAKQLMADIVEALTNSSLIVPGFQVGFKTISYRHVFNDPDGVTRHGVLRVEHTLYQMD